MPANPYLSIEKAFRILELLAVKAPMGVTAVAAELGLEKSGVSRLLKMLSDRGYVVQASSRGQYRLGPRVLVLAEQYLQGDRLVQEARPVLRAMAETARASAHLAVAVGLHMVVAAKEPSPERIQVDSRVGGRIAPHASALGKVLLAGMPESEASRFLPSSLARFTDRTITDRRRVLRLLDDVRRKGYALETGEEHAGVGCIGAPVRDASGRWIAAVSVSGPLQGTPFTLDRARIDLVVARAAELSQRMGYGGNAQFPMTGDA